MEKFVIDRATWIRGEGSDLGESQLLNKEGKMCCLGFFMKAAGYADEELLGQARPSDAVENFPLKEDICFLLSTTNRGSFPNESNDRMDWKSYEESMKDSDICIKMMKCNDFPIPKDSEEDFDDEFPLDSHFPRSEGEREEILKKMFLEQGIVVEFK